jgi:hypothetical protein
MENKYILKQKKIENYLPIFQVPVRERACKGYSYGTTKNEFL